MWWLLTRNSIATNNIAGYEHYSRPGGSKALKNCPAAEIER
jgi:hypothetical protein